VPSVVHPDWLLKALKSREEQNKQHRITDMFARRKLEVKPADITDVENIVPDPNNKAHLRGMGRISKLKNVQDGENEQMEDAEAAQPVANDAGNADQTTSTAKKPKGENDEEGSDDESDDENGDDKDEQLDIVDDASEHPPIKPLVGVDVMAVDSDDAGSSSEIIQAPEDIGPPPKAPQSCYMMFVNEFREKERLREQQTVSTPTDTGDDAMADEGEENQKGTIASSMPVKGSGAKKITEFAKHAAERWKLLSEEEKEVRHSFIMTKKFDHFIPCQVLILI
jgi:hypothetical protein